MFTKYDMLAEDIERRWIRARKSYNDAEVDLEADRYLKERCIQRIEELTGQKGIPYIAVSCESTILIPKLPQINFVFLSKAPLPGEADTTD